MINFISLDNLERLINTMIRWNYKIKIEISLRQYKKSILFLYLNSFKITINIK